MNLLRVYADISKHAVNTFDNAVAHCDNKAEGPGSLVVPGQRGVQGEYGLQEEQGDTAQCYRNGQKAICGSVGLKGL